MAQRSPKEILISVYLLFVILIIVHPSFETRKGKKSDDLYENGNKTITLPLQHTSQVSVVKIGSFNLKQFGTKKSSNEQVLKIIAKIVLRYHLIALQEITDVKETSMKKLIAAVNQDSSFPYHSVSSPRVGRTNQKEQYGLIFRSDVFQVKRHIIFDDSSIGDAFSREPHISEIIIKQTGEKLLLINVHIAPKNASTEINSLVDVHTWVVDKWRIRNIVILGDLNADCEYIRKKDIPYIRLLSNRKKYDWLIPNSVDTTVGNTNCAYDRIIVSGPLLKRTVVANSARAFEFDKVYRLEQKVALNVSDHYPVEFSMNITNTGALVREEPNPMQTSSCENVSRGYSVYAVAIASYKVIFRILFQLN